MLGPSFSPEHDEDAGADQQPEQARSGGKAALGAGCRDADAIVGAIDVFVSNDYGFGFGWVARASSGEGLRAFAVI